MCQVHGAGSPKQGRPGGARPRSFRYVKGLPTRLRDQLEVALTDSELLNLREDIALIDTRNNEILAGINIGEAGALWRQAKQYYAALADAMRSQDAQRTQAAFQDLGVILNRGVGAYAGWQELMNNLALRSKLVEGEQRRLERMKLMITAEDATKLIDAIMASVERNVYNSALPSDEAERVIRIIFGDAARYLDGSNTPALPAEPDETGD